MTRSLASTTWDDFLRPPSPKLLEPQNPKAIEVIHFKATSEALEITYYREGILKEQFESIDLDTLREWAFEKNEIAAVYELPYYDEENGEEYLVVYPPTSEPGNAEQINCNRFERWVKSLNDTDIERILQSILKIS